ncbi:hypothetical protein OKA05_09055 [Luteolibacter arcticus]|uniref:DNA polymerase beta thumb domain-containing protein n=1 Tax=Luteolibacter arcticus TaxID=1581411 RepID=A0ABT3GHA7_9BACT|nr:hypothetical protein [Luteolibacter arcticus]MCW1922700.1 hypothetical protein [Luteolibacter arcticus]
MKDPATKPRFDRDFALVAAGELAAVLEPLCSRMAIAGSIRRGKLLVGDVEILYIPRFEERPVDLLDMGLVNLADEAIAGMLASGILTKRPDKNGNTAWGDKNKLALHSSGVPIDLFSATDANWWNYLVCRTGPADSNTRIATAAQARGWKWNPYGSGFTRIATGETHACHSEEAVFAFVGLPYLPPEKRQ